MPGYEWSDRVSGTPCRHARRRRLVGLPDFYAACNQGSEEERQAAIDLARSTPGVVDVVDALEVMDLEPDVPDVLFGQPTRPAEWEPLLEESDPTDDDEWEMLELPDEEREQFLPPRGIITYDPGRVEYSGSTDERVAVEEGVPYFPPVDPPVDNEEGPDPVEVAAGFQPSAMDDDDEPEPYEDSDEVNDVRDAEIVERIVRELNEDSATAHLNIHVSSVSGTVILTGYVDDQTDADMAVEVADRVPGVREVVDRLVVGQRPSDVRRPRIRRVERARRQQVGAPSVAWRATVARNERWLQEEYDRVTARIAALKDELARVAQDQADEGVIANHQGDIASEVTAAEVLTTEIAALEDELEAIRWCCAASPVRSATRNDSTVNADPHDGRPRRGTTLNQRAGRPTPPR